MIHLLIKLFFLLALVFWGDWKNWQKYYPTILFLIIGDLLYNLMFYSYPMWSFHYGPNPLEYPEIFIVFAMLLITYPATVLIYLGRFPLSRMKGSLWVFAWVVLFTAIEIFDMKDIKEVEKYF